MTKVKALVGKELTDLRRNPAVFFPAALTGFLSILLPLIVAIAVPYFTGEHLSDSSDFQIAVELYRHQPITRGLEAEGAIQAWIFQQFLVLLMLTPVAGSMSVAAYSVIGEKQARTLEPLLATPITTLELLTAKVLGALIPAVVLMTVCYVTYLMSVAALAERDVFWILLTPHAIAVVFLLGPLAALVGLQLAVCVSSRVNDPRSAQQIGAFIILPICGLLLAQLMGDIQLTPRLMTIIGLVLVIINLALMRIAIVLFRRESILTRWK
jgi:ABC-2 type transport system permease protein